MLGSRLIRNIFATSHQNEIGAGRFNHCSSVCPYRQGVLLAWYAGTGECQDDQSVHISFCDKSGTYSDPIRLGDKTGNPVIWAHRDHAYLLWSKFEDAGDLRSIVDRWKFCSLWIQQIELKDKITFVGDPIQISSSDNHLLGRCNPLKICQVTLDGGFKTDYLLPLYDELARNGAIYKIDITKSTSRRCHINTELYHSKISTLGCDMIQPTLWKENYRLHSLSRNFGPNRDMQSKYCYSDDWGQTWSDAIETDIPNRNSSLHAVSCGRHNLLLWNDTTTTRRINLQLGLLTIGERDGSPVPHVNRLCKISDLGGYPSMCIDNIGNLHMTFSNANRKIEHHVWNAKQLNKSIRN